MLIKQESARPGGPRATCRPGEVSTRGDVHRGRRGRGPTWCQAKLRSTSRGCGTRESPRRAACRLRGIPKSRAARNGPVNADRSAGASESVSASVSVSVSASVRVHVRVCLFPCPRPSVSMSESASVSVSESSSAATSMSVRVRVCIRVCFGGVPVLHSEMLGLIDRTN